MIGSTDHTQKHIALGISSGLAWLRRSLLLSSQKQIKSPFYLGRGKSFNYIWPIAIGSSQSVYHNYVTSSSSYQVLSTRSPRIRICQRKRNIAIEYQEQIIAPHPPQKNQKKKSKEEEEVTVKIRYLVKRKCIISGQSE